MRERHIPTHSLMNKVFHITARKCRTSSRTKNAGHFSLFYYVLFWRAVYQYYVPCLQKETPPKVCENGVSDASLVGDPFHPDSEVGSRRIFFPKVPSSSFYECLEIPPLPLPSFPLFSPWNCSARHLRLVPPPLSPDTAFGVSKAAACHRPPTHV